MERGSDVRKGNVEVHRGTGTREEKKEETMSRAAGRGEEDRGIIGRAPSTGKSA